MTVSNDIGPLYHWSPRTRLSSIKKQGLVPRKPPVYTDDGFRQSGVCFSLDPATAWNHSHEVFQVPGIYDLWQVEPVPTDEVHVLPMWGGRVLEVRVMNKIPKARLVWVGERTIPNPG